MQDDDRFLVPVARKSKLSVKSWIKALGFWGFVFFLLKGLLWLTIPALVAIFSH